MQNNYDDICQMWIKRKENNDVVKFLWTNDAIFDDWYERNVIKVLL